MNKFSLFLLAILSNQSFASFNGNFDFFGYIGYRYIWSSIGEAPMESYPEIGLLGNINFNKNLSLFTQLNINENALEESLEHGIIYSFLTYQNKFKSIPFKIEIGKLRHDVGLNNADIVNPSTRQGVIAPQSIYWENLGSTLKSGYGVSFKAFYKDFSFNYTIDQHVVINKEKEATVWAGSPLFKMDPHFGSHQIVNLNYTPSDSNYIIKSSFTKLYLNKSINSIEFLSLAYKYNNYDYYFSSELVIVKPHNIHWDKVNDLRYGYSVTIGKYFNDDLEIHMNYNSYENSKLQSLGLGVSAFADEWKDISIGFSENFGNLELKADLHNVHGGIVLNDLTKDFKNWWYFGTSLVFHF